jgi:hypothetical protein
VTAVAAIAGWLELAGSGAPFALGRAAAVLAIASPLAVLAAHLRPAELYAGPPPAKVEDYVVTHVLVPTGGSEDAVLAAAAVAEGDSAIVRASRRAAEQRGATLEPAVADGVARLMPAAALREAGLDVPTGALNGLEQRQTVVWVVERWRVTGALALEPRGRPLTGNSARQGRLRSVLPVAYNLVALPLAAGLLPGMYPLPATGALISGLFAAGVALLATRPAKAPAP